MAQSPHDFSFWRDGTLNTHCVGEHYCVENVTVLVHITTDEHAAVLNIEYVEHMTVQHVTVLNLLLC